MSEVTIQVSQDEIREIVAKYLKEKKGYDVANEDITFNIDNDEFNGCTVVYTENEITLQDEFDFQTSDGREIFQPIYHAKFGEPLRTFYGIYNADNELVTTFSTSDLMSAIKNHRFVLVTK